ncbi:MAG: flagellar basal body rod protein FlgC [Acidimicrobiia bacterium]|nr:flagellar basal body rod protein FlgC [Acidimicrobiia bacterium]
MGTFDTLNIAASGAGVGKTWIDAIAHNIANVNTIRPPEEEPFRSKIVIAAARTDGSGVDVVGIDETRQEPPKAYDPTHPYADEDGNVTRAAVDLAGQMADLIAAQRSYQANLSVIRSGREAYEAAMRIGQ